MVKNQLDLYVKVYLL